jgi:hypothetical protein
MWVTVEEGKSRAARLSRIFCVGMQLFGLALGSKWRDPGFRLDSRRCYLD